MPSRRCLRISANASLGKARFGVDRGGVGPGRVGRRARTRRQIVLANADYPGSVHPAFVVVPLQYPPISLKGGTVIGTLCGESRYWDNP